MGARVEMVERERRVSAVVAKPVVQQQQSQEVILKIRVAGSSDPDYVELELPSEAMTLEYLTVAACEELAVGADQIERVRKMPNTRLRRDREVARLTDYQEVELVLRIQQWADGGDGEVANSASKHKTSSHISFP